MSNARSPLGVDSTTIGTRLEVGGGGGREEEKGAKEALEIEVDRGRRRMEEVEVDANVDDVDVGIDSMIDGIVIVADARISEVSEAAEEPPNRPTADARRAARSIAPRRMFFDWKVERMRERNERCELVLDFFFFRPLLCWRGFRRFFFRK